MANSNTQTTGQMKDILEAVQPVYSAFKRNGFEDVARTLASKYGNDPINRLGRYIAIVDANYEFPGHMRGDIFSEARREILHFTHMQKARALVHQDKDLEERAAKLDFQVKAIFGVQE